MRIMIGRYGTDFRCRCSSRWIGLLGCCWFDRTVRCRIGLLGWWLEGSSARRIARSWAVERCRTGTDGWDCRMGCTWRVFSGSWGCMGDCSARNGSLSLALPGCRRWRGSHFVGYAWGWFAHGGVLIPWWWAGWGLDVSDREHRYFFHSHSSPPSSQHLQKLMLIFPFFHENLQGTDPPSTFPTPPKTHFSPYLVLMSCHPRTWWLFVGRVVRLRDDSQRSPHYTKLSNVLQSWFPACFLWFRMSRLSCTDHHSLGGINSGRRLLQERWVEGAMTIFLGFFPLALLNLARSRTLYLTLI